MAVDAEFHALALVFSRAFEGGISREALERLALEPLVREAASGPAAMCLASAVPVGLLHAADLRGITEDAAAACRLMHADPRCVAACRAVAMAVALAVRGEADQIVDRASLLASPSPPVREAVEGAERGLPGSAERAVSHAFSALRLGAPVPADPLSAAVAGALLGATTGSRRARVAAPTIKERDVALPVGSQAPDFRLPSTSGGESSLSDFRGKKVVVYFYPKDETPGCTRESCDFRDNYQPILATGAEVLGISSDSMASHDKFRSHHGLPFPLLSDPGHEVAKAWGAYGEKNMYGRTVVGTIRSTYLVDENGNIAAAWSPVRVDGHVAQVVTALGGTPVASAMPGAALSPARKAARAAVVVTAAKAARKRSARKAARKAPARKAAARKAARKAPARKASRKVSARKTTARKATARKSKRKALARKPGRRNVGRRRPARRSR